MIDSKLLLDQFLFTGLPVTGVTVSPTVIASSAGITRWYGISDGSFAGVTWSQQPSQQQETRAQAVIAAFNPAINPYNAFFNARVAELKSGVNGADPTKLNVSDLKALMLILLLEHGWVDPISGKVSIR